MANYNPPKWMADPGPNTEWKLDEIKNGVIVDSHKLNNSLIIFGRIPEVKGGLPVITAHESCSRLHARIAFDSNGTPWLRDLGSGNGTKVNKKSLPKKSLGKAENQSGEGARGVVLFPGDLIQLGASTRVYALDGPREFDRGSMKANQQQAIMLKNQHVNKISGEEVEESKSGDMSWGISFDDAADNDEDSTMQRNSQLAVDIQDIPNKHRKLYGNIEAKKYKLANIQLEMQRIQNKSSSSELTSGQTKQLESLEQREKNLLQEVSELEINLREKMNSSESHALSKRGRHVDEDDVDDFFDRTCHKRSKMDGAQQSTAETDLSLMERCKLLFAKWKVEKAQVEILKTKVDEIEHRLQSTGEGDEEYFFLKNDLDLVSDQYNAAVCIVQSVVDGIDEVEKLLRIVNDKIIIDRGLAFVGDLSTHKSLVESHNEKLVGYKVNASKDVMAMPPPRTKPEVRSMEQSMMPPPIAISSRPAMPVYKIPKPPPTIKQSQYSNAKKVDGSAPQPSTGKDILSVKQVRGPERPAQGTLSFLSLDAKKATTKKSGEKKSTKLSSTPNNGTNGFDSQKDNWVAPQGQDGSGITKLNAKFQGRY